MTANPDYGISAVHYNKNHTHIVSVKVHQIKHGKVGAEEVWKRARVASSIEKGLNFVTLLEGTDGKWKTGEHVSILHKRYLRTNPDEEAARDDLGDLVIRKTF